MRIEPQLAVAKVHGAGTQDRRDPGDGTQLWGRSTQDLVQTLDDLHSWKVSVLAQTGLSFDLSTASGKLMRTIMAGLAEFERDLIRERVKSGLAAARSRGVLLGRQVVQRPSEKESKKVLQLHEEGLSYRLIGRNVGLSKNMRTLDKTINENETALPSRVPAAKK